MKRIAAITSVRNDPGFLPRWIAYYGAVLGPENLFVIIDGHDQPVPDAPMVNVLRVPFVSRPRARGDKARAARATGLAHALLTSFDLVLGTDVDEFLVPDPRTGQGLAAYLSDQRIKTSLSAVGLDVVQHMHSEGPLDPARPVLAQRQFAKLSDRYTKASVLARPVRWGSGQHRVRGHSYHVDPQLYLFHIGNADCAALETRRQDADRQAEGWAGHQKRREALFDEVAAATPQAFDDLVPKAAEALQRRRRWPSWNKPARLRGPSIVQIDQRFSTIV